MHLLLIETSGNQKYIFSTNKLKENVGASELTYRAGTEYVFDAIKSISNSQLCSSNVREFRENIRNRKPPPPVNEENKVEVIVATSGKAILLVYDYETGKDIIRHVTCKALKKAPGMDVFGIISDHFELESRPLGEINRELHKRFERERAKRAGPALRFLRLPVVIDCATSGLPAAERDTRDSNDIAARSAVSIAKRDNAEHYRERMNGILASRALEGMGESLETFAKNIGELEKQSDWLAVAHADGNGLGKIFKRFDEYSGCVTPKENGKYIDQLRRFSLALDICTERAFLTALEKLLGRKAYDKIPIVPIVLGGDDMTVVCEGRSALQFTRDFLEEFEKETAIKDDDHLDGIIPDMAMKASGSDRLSSCAGVAIIKPHFPFSGAYHLAEQLIKSAKKVKEKVIGSVKGEPWPCSAIDFHALYDASGSDLDRIRATLHIDEDGTRLYGRPYVITDDGKLEGAKEEGRKWAKNHNWSHLENRVEAIFAEDEDGRRTLPNSQLHDLRAGLFLGRKTADARYRLIGHRYEKMGIGAFDEDGQETLFYEEIDDEGKRRNFTRLLDALDASTFWIEENEENKK